MSLGRLTYSLNQVTKVGSWATCKVMSFEDESKSDFWWVLLQEQSLTTFPGPYVNINGGISSNFLLDNELTSVRVQALFSIDTKTGDICCHYVGHGKLTLPNVANSSGMKYGIIDIEVAVNTLMNMQPTAQPTALVTAVCPVVIKVPDTGPLTYRVLGRSTSVCDCGGRKLGYADDQPWGHGSWCKIHEKLKAEST